MEKVENNQQTYHPSRSPIKLNSLDSKALYIKQNSSSRSNSIYSIREETEKEIFIPSLGLLNSCNVNIKDVINETNNAGNINKNSHIFDEYLDNANLLNSNVILNKSDYNNRKIVTDKNENYIKTDSRNFNISENTEKKIDNNFNYESNIISHNSQLNSSKKFSQKNSSGNISNDVYYFLIKNSLIVNENIYIDQNLLERALSFFNINDKEKQLENKYSFFEDNIIKHKFLLIDYIVKQLGENSYFGDLSLDSIKKKRTATVKGGDNDSILGFLPKEIYHYYILLKKQQLIQKNLYMLNNISIFKNIKSSVFQRYYFPWFKAKEFFKNEILAEENEELIKIYFIRNGKLDISLKANVFEIHKLMILIINRLKIMKIINDEMYKHYISQYIDNFSLKDIQNNTNKSQKLENMSKYVHLFTIGSGELLGLEPYMLGTKLFFNAIAHSEKVKTYSIEISSFRHIMNIYPESKRNFIKITLSKTNALIKRLNSIKISYLKIFENHYNDGISYLNQYNQSCESNFLTNNRQQKNYIKEVAENNKPNASIEKTFYKTIMGYNLAEEKKCKNFKAIVKQKYKLDAARFCKIKRKNDKKSNDNQNSSKKMINNYDSFRSDHSKSDKGDLIENYKKNNKNLNYSFSEVKNIPSNNDLFKINSYFCDSKSQFNKTNKVDLNQESFSYSKDINKGRKIRNFNSPNNSDFEDNINCPSNFSNNLNCNNQFLNYRYNSNLLEIISQSPMKSSSETQELIISSPMIITSHLGDLQNFSNEINKKKQNFSSDINKTNVNNNHKNHYQNNSNTFNSRNSHVKILKNRNNIDNNKNLRQNNNILHDENLQNRKNENIVNNTKYEIKILLANSMQLEDGMGTFENFNINKCNKNSQIKKNQEMIRSISCANVANPIREIEILKFSVAQKYQDDEKENQPEGKKLEETNKSRNQDFYKFDMKNLNQENRENLNFYSQSLIKSLNTSDTTNHKHISSDCKFNNDDHDIEVHCNNNEGSIYNTYNKEYLTLDNIANSKKIKHLINTQKRDSPEKVPMASENPSFLTKTDSYFKLHSRNYFNKKINIANASLFNVNNSDLNNFSNDFYNTKQANISINNLFDMKSSQISFYSGSKGLKGFKQVKLNKSKNQKINNESNIFSSFNNNKVYNNGILEKLFLSEEKGFQKAERLNHNVTDKMTDDNYKAIYSNIEIRDCELGNNKKETSKKLNEKNSNGLIQNHPKREKNQKQETKTTQEKVDEIIEKHRTSVEFLLLKKAKKNQYCGFSRNVDDCCFFNNKEKLQITNFHMPINNKGSENPLYHIKKNDWQNGQNKNFQVFRTNYLTKEKCHNINIYNHIIPSLCNNPYKKNHDRNSKSNSIIIPRDLRIRQNRNQTYLVKNNFSLIQNKDKTNEKNIEKIDINIKTIDKYVPNKTNPTINEINKKKINILKFEDMANLIDNLKNTSVKPENKLLKKDNKNNRLDKTFAEFKEIMEEKEVSEKSFKYN